MVARDSRGKETGLKLQPDRAVMSDEEKTRARARMDGGAGSVKAPPATPLHAAPVDGADWQRSPLYARVAALLRHADSRLPRLEGSAKARVDHLAGELRAALSAGDAERVAAREQELIDTLFELD